MRYFSGQEEHLSLLDVHILECAIFHDFQAHVSLPHEKQLFALLQVIIGPLIRPSHIENLESKKNAIFRFAKGAGGLKQIQKINNVEEKELLQKCYSRKVA